MDKATEQENRRRRKVKPTTKKSSAVGDASTMREALTKVEEWMEHRIATGGFEFSMTIPTMLEDVVLPALAAVPRNCDRFSDETKAMVAFLNEAWFVSVKDLKEYPFYKWTPLMKERYAKWLMEREGETK